MFFAHNAGHGDRLDAAGKKKGLWVAITKRLQHFVPAVLVDLVRASTQCLHETETFDAAAAPFSDAILIKTYHNRRPMVLVRYARGHDSENTGMPVTLEHDNRRIE